MADINPTMLYEGVAVDFVFTPGLEFGDLFAIYGYEHPSFRPTEAYAFHTLADLGFTQVDDFFSMPPIVARTSPDGARRWKATTCAARLQDRPMAAVQGQFEGYDCLGFGTNDQVLGPLRR